MTSHAAEIRELRAVPSTDDLLLQRCRYLMDQLAVAQDEMSAALLVDDVEVACRAGRKLSSVGWLFREATDKHRDAA